MKVIDLLNKIANGEEVPEKIKYDNQIFEYREDMKDYYCYDYDLNLMGYQKILNDEVEIIEDIPKKIEKLEISKEIDEEDYYANILQVSKNGECEIDEALSVVIDKLNEVIDYINKGENND